MQLPHLVQHYISQRIEGIPMAVLAKAAESLSNHYRGTLGTSSMQIPANHKAAAYLATRMPGTYAAAMHVLSELHRHRPAGIASVLDLGAGTGAASLASQTFFGNVSLTLLDQDSALLGEAKRLIPMADFIQADLVAKKELPPVDLVIACYCLAELPEADRAGVLQKAWLAAGSALVVVEPGTSLGFKRILEIRDQLIGLGGHLMAPCPNAFPCPIESPDWCHFAERVERSAIHRRLKQGTKGYEDEKFCYLIFSKTPVEAVTGRIVRRPQHQPGLIQLSVCQDQKVTGMTISKRDRNLFRLARRANWGDGWSEGPNK